MIEDNTLNNEKKNKKKILIGSMIIVLILVVIVVGTTYAYFTMGTINNSEDTEITIKTGKANNIKLTGGIESYKIHLEVADMAFNRVNNNYYGTTDDSKNYETTKEDGTQIIGNLELEGELVDDYVCTASVNVDLSGNMQSELHENDLVLVIIQGNTETEYDLSKSMTLSSFKFNLSKIEPIKAYLKFTNQNTDQSGLAGKTLNVTINVEDFKCEVRKSVLTTLQKTTDSDHLKTVVENDELIRYVGTYEEIKNNYICFGTTDTNTCTSEPDTYMYRIIGVTSDNVNTELGLVPDQLKIIKATPSNTNQVWYNDYDVNYNWNDTNVEVKIYLNDTFLETITGTLGTHQWSDLISNPKWYIGDITGNSANPPKKESANLISNENKIGLMYASDYYNSYIYGSNTSSWLNICHGRTETNISCGNTYEWTMSRYGSSNNHYEVWSVYSGGHLNVGWVNDQFSVRPVLYLTPDIRLSGEGTESNPFLISEE